MTPGYFLDLLVINAVRKEKLGDSLDDEVKLDLEKQDGFLLREIGKTLLEISDGKRPGTFAKHKNYDKRIGEMENSNLIETLYFLYRRHSELWDLEDQRRDVDNNSDDERLSAADCVSIVNKKRNDLVEMVDKIIDGRLKQTKLWGSLVE
jgi:hypothetical protein